MFAIAPDSRLASFTIKPDGETVTVCLAGDFTEWKLVRMQKQEDGTFAMTLLLSRGSYEYKFIVDGRWITDPGNSSYTMSPLGTFNSVAIVS